MYLDDANIRNADAEIAEFESPLKSVVQVSEFASPVRAAMEYGNKPEMKGAKIILGASTKDGDAAERFDKNVQKYVKDAEVLNSMDYAFKPVGEVLSATDFRNALKNDEDIERFLPDTSKDRVDYIADMVKGELKEENEPFLGIFRGLVDEVLEEKRKKKKKKLTKSEIRKRDKNAKEIMKSTKKQYGEEEGEDIAYAIATKQVKKPEDIEEVSAISAGAVAMGPRKKRKVTENEVNEALNYLLQKLGV